METKLIHETCEKFTELLAAKSSIPGGGGAAALAGAMGVALCEMAGNFTIGKKKYAEFEDDIKKILDEAERLRAKFLELVDDDAKNFTPLAEAYKIPKDDPARNAAIEAATINACKVPLEIMKASADAIKLLEVMQDKGSAMLISDVGCGAVLCSAAIQSAAMNIFTNTLALHDREAARKIDNEADEIMKEFLPRAEKISREITQRMRGN